jgi:hypothetical protein
MLAPSTQLDAPCAPGAQAAAISAAARSLRTGCKHESEPRMDVCGERKLRRSVSKLPIQKICIKPETAAVETVLLLGSYRRHEGHR